MVMKKEWETNDFIIKELEEDNQEEDLKLINEKLVKMKHALNNRTTKKSEMTQLQMRLVHFHFRLSRMGKVLDAVDLERAVLTLLKEHFAGPSKNPQKKETKQEMNLLRKTTVKMIAVHLKLEKSLSQRMKRRNIGRNQRKILRKRRVKENLESTRNSSRG